MIEKNEILAFAHKLSLNPDTVEKDYVLNWLLWGIYQQATLKSTWIFKGGTCLKKCFLDTFRFSEDLDFTVTHKQQLTSENLMQCLSTITEQVYEETGIEFFTHHFKCQVLPRKNDHVYSQVKIPYNGPLRRKRKVATIKLDLTSDEILVLKPAHKQVYHPYSDKPKMGIWATCYAFEEVMGEKIRALSQRARPRDLYDVIHFFRNRAMVNNPRLIHQVLVKKCEYKYMDTPSFETMQSHEKRDELAAQWQHMLAHQLPSLPPLESFLKDLLPFFDWLSNNLEEKQ